MSMADSGRRHSKVTQLNIYPVKSCRGISVHQGQITATGLQYDRQWMVVNERGRMCTVRSDPRLILVNVELPPEVLRPGWEPLSLDASLQITAPGMRPLHIPLLPRTPDPEHVPASVWEWAGEALDEGPDARAWFTEYLKKPCSFVRYSPVVSNRPTSAKWSSGYKVAFADGFPFLLISEASLAKLNEKLTEELPMNRFRPNIVVDSCEAFEEDMWDTFNIVSPGGNGGATFRSVKPCSRCKITTTDMETAAVHPEQEPLKTLRTFRQGHMLGLVSHSKDKQVYFGMNLVCQQFKDGQSSPRIVSVGDEIDVVLTRESYAPFHDLEEGED